MGAAEKKPREAARESVADRSAIPERLLSITEARERLGDIGKTWIFAQIKLRRLRVVKLGRRTLIRESEVQRLIDEGSQP